MSDRDWLEEMERSGLTRRAFVKGGLAGAGALSLGGLLAACGGDDDDGGAAAQQAGTAEAEPFTGTLKVTGLGVDLIDPIKEAAEAALGFTLAFDVTDTVTARNKVVTQPEALDIFSGYFNDIDQVWPSGNMAPIPIDQIERWDELTGLYKTGKIQENEANPACQLGDGDAPFRKLYTTEDGELTSWADPATGEVSGDEPAFVTLVGGNFNMDSMGYNGEVIQREPDEVNWDELLNPEWRGRVAVLNDPSIGMQDVGQRRRGRRDDGVRGPRQHDAGGDRRPDQDPPRPEGKGQFRAFWTTFDESVTLMQSGEVVIESMWSPAVALLQSSGHPTRYAAPAGGFRGWAGGHGIMNARRRGPVQVPGGARLHQLVALRRARRDHDAPGLLQRRAGHEPRVRRAVRVGLLDRRQAGGPADSEPVRAGDGRHSGRLRPRRRCLRRPACVYSSWNSLMDEQQYQVQRWNEFLAA